jgi:hypothetical protein
MMTRIRKQVYDLTTEDFRRYPLWEFCLDEEGTEGQDEATVKPSDDSEVPGYSPGAYVMAADFKLSDGSSMEGYIYSSEPDDFSCAQPNIIVESGQINFWFGIRVPEVEKLKRIYERLGKTSGQLFPLGYKTRVEINGSRLNGTIKGFGARTLKDPKPLIFS